MIRAIKRVAFCALLAISGVSFFGCASTSGGVERPEALTGQSVQSSSSSSDASGTRFQWGGKGIQYGRVTR